MTLRSMEIFLTIAETGSMSKAAEKLMITQSSVSQVVLEIEKEYNVILFERFNHSLKLTTTGEEMLKYVKNILLLNRELTNVLEHESKNQRIRLGATVSVGSTVMEPIVKDMMKVYPKLEHSVFVANTKIIETMLLNNELDIGLVEGVVESPDLVVKTAIDDRMVLICANTHRFAGRKSISIRELDGEPLVVREEGSGTRFQLIDELNKHNIKPVIRWNSYGFEAIKDAVENGFGVSVISKRLVVDDVKEGKYWMCEINDCDFARSFKLVYHKDKYLTGTMKIFSELTYKYGRENGIS